ncbi:MAG TPA: ImmA/IrrE family metallo-endopeptidase [Solirubrobacterales bacterium]|nr:ImmA/IrrE family metallo-endopeptidase [Solirubrobacterales bacterium]
MEPGRDAWELLKRVWMTEGPDRIILPVDPIELSEKIGIVALLDDEMEPEVSGVLKKESGFRDPEILLNPIDTRDRRRFICAHAIGHYSRNVEMRRNGAWNVVEGRDFFAPSSDPDESYATEFAGELLMPRAVLRELDDTTSTASLASLFGVTGDVMSARLDRIGWRR